MTKAGVFAYVCRCCPHLATVHRPADELPVDTFACQLCECVATQADFNGTAGEATVRLLYGSSMRWLNEQVIKRNNDQAEATKAAKAALAVAAQRHLATLCQAESDVVMPPLAQKIHGGRLHYHCGRAGRHLGKHRWPADPSVPALAEW